MGSTKIIHVLKNDGFEEIFDLFRNTEASEVIFIFPKGSKLARQSQHFSAIKREADSSGKRVSIMTADPIVAQFASQNNLELLKTPESKKREATVLNYTPEPVVVLADNSDPEEQADENEDNVEPRVQLAAARTNNPPRTIKDIVGPEREIKRPIKIREERAKPFEVEIARGIQEGRVTGDITQVWTSRENETRQIFKPAQSIRRIKSSAIFRRSPLFFVGGAVVVLFLILYATLGSAQITIKPRKQPLNFQIKASASNIATAINLDFNRVPGQHFGYKDEESGTFPTTGQKEVVQKAGGKITIYNKSASSQRLVATTRFKSPSGLIFRIPETISVPAATGSGINLKEGSIESLVYADKAGSDYNISPAIFTIPGFEGTPKFNDFYAKSTQSMTGGIIGPSKVVTEEDFAKAQETITAKLKEKVLRALKDQAGELKILDSTEIKLDPPVTNAKVGGAAETLQMTIKGVASTMAFRKSDALELVKSYVSQKGDLELLEKNLTINYLNPQNNADNSIMTFDIQATGQSATNIDQDKILKDILGMREDAIRNYFKNIKEIESARVTLSPFWVTSIPKDPGKVKLVIEKE